MARIRLGKAERGLVRAWHKQRLAKKQAIVNANLDAPRPEFVRYSTVDIRQGYQFHDHKPLRSIAKEFLPPQYRK